MRLKKFAVIMFAMLVMLGMSQRPAKADLYLGSYFIGWHTWVKSIGYHSGWVSPTWSGPHVNLDVYWTPVYGWFYEGSKQANFHVCIRQGCLYMYDTGTKREYWKCIDWRSWSSMRDSIANEVRNAVRDRTGAQITDYWLWCVVALLIVPCLFFAL